MEAWRTSVSDHRLRCCVLSRSHRSLLFLCSLSDSFCVWFVLFLRTACFSGNTTILASRMVPSDLLPDPGYLYMEGVKIHEY